MKNGKLTADDFNRSPELGRKKAAGGEITDSEMLGVIKSMSYDIDCIKWQMAFSIGSCCYAHRDEYKKDPKVYEKKFEKDKEEFIKNRNNND